MTDNADQRDFWSSAAGRSWTANQTAMDAVLQPVLDLVLSTASLRPGDAVIDIGCGTGASTIHAAQAVGSKGQVEGIDISPVLLDLARMRTVAAQNVILHEADAQTHSFAPKAADAIISRFGVMFFADPTAAFANMARALKPGARMTMAAWGPAPQNPWFMEPARVAQDRLGKMPKTDRTLPGPFAFEDAERTHALLTAAGLDVTITPVDLALGTLEDIETLADLSCNIGPAVGVMAEFDATDADRAAITEGIAKAFSAYPDGVPAHLNLISATL